MLRRSDSRFGRVCEKLKASRRRKKVSKTGDFVQLINFRRISRANASTVYRYNSFLSCRSQAIEASLSVFAPHGYSCSQFSTQTSTRPRAQSFVGASLQMIVRWCTIGWSGRAAVCSPWSELEASLESTIRNSHSHNARLPLVLDDVIDDSIGLTTSVAAITPADPKGYISRFRRSFSKPVDEFKTISDPFEKVRGLMQALSYYLYVLNSHRERDSGYKPSSRPVLRIHNLMSLSRRSSSQLLHTLLSRPSVRPKRGN